MIYESVFGRQLTSFLLLLLLFPFLSRHIEMTEAFRVVARARKLSEKLKTENSIWAFSPNVRRRCIYQLEILRVTRSNREDDNYRCSDRAHMLQLQQ